MCVSVCERGRKRKRKREKKREGERVRKNAWELNVHTNRKCDVILVEQKQFCKMDVCVFVCVCVHMCVCVCERKKVCVFVCV